MTVSSRLVLVVRKGILVVTRNVMSTEVIEKKLTVLGKGSMGSESHLFIPILCRINVE